MVKKQNNLTIKRFVSTKGKNQYFLLSAGEAAVIDVSEASDELCEIPDKMGIGLKFFFITHAHRFHFQARSLLKRKYGGTFCLHEYEY